MRPPKIRAALAGAAVLVGTGTALSQDAVGGLRLTLGVSSGLRAHDNFDLNPVSAGPTVRSDTRLTFGLESETRRQRLALSFGGALRIGEASGTGFAAGLEDPSANFNYVLDGANARASVDASFSRAEVDGFAILEEGEEPGEIDLIADSGTRDSYHLGMTLETGLQAPLGFVVELGHRGTRYTGTSDPGLFDRATISASATAVLQFSPVTEGRVIAHVERYEAEDAVSTMRDIRTLSFGVKHEFLETTMIEASIGGREIDDSVTGVTHNAEASLSLTHALPRGSVGLSLSTELTPAGQQSRVEAERHFTFPAGTLTFSLGAVDGDGIDPQPIGSLEYHRDLPRGAMTASLSRGVSVNDEAGIQRTTRGALGLLYDVNVLSSVSFDLDYTDIDDAGAGGITDRARGSFRATYRHELGQDWALSAGYERRYLNEAGTGAAWDNAVFVTIDRTFSWLP